MDSAYRRNASPCQPTGAAWHTLVRQDRSTYTTSALYRMKSFEEVSCPGARSGLGASGFGDKEGALAGETPFVGAEVCAGDTRLEALSAAEDRLSCLFAGAACAGNSVPARARVAVRVMSMLWVMVESKVGGGRN